jgi:tripartite-type tricarboxylate transporter receptor subunit TctC
MGGTNIMPKIHALALTVAGVVLALTTAAIAQQYPTKPIRMIVPFAPGGSVDVVARAIATPLGERLGRQMIVDNRAGAGGVVGAELVANAPKDGYTLLVNSLSHATNPWLYQLPFDSIKGFAPISMIASGPIVLVVNPELPVKSVAELIALARAKPGQLQYASAGVGTFTHLGAELFKIAADVNLLHVPFRGGGPAIIDVVAGHTKIAFANLLTATPHIRSGKLRTLGVGGTKRLSTLPDVPTIAEAGVPGYEAINWWGILAPAGTPAAIVAQLHTEIAAVQSNPAVQKLLAGEGAEVVNMSSAEFTAFLILETDKWGRVVKEGGIKAQ